ncbi:hypothetical protein SB751_30680, partial [Cupriavidus sp. SIMBA_020]|uniref:hypothetical protein n=1 Tax=Cupriavidus sp. SIMBA_020 TaxID=3085766 RepID=UPI00397AA65A
AAAVQPAAALLPLRFRRPNLSSAFLESMNFTRRSRQASPDGLFTVADAITTAFPVNLRAVFPIRH